MSKQKTIYKTLGFYTSNEIENFKKDVQINYQEINEGDEKLTDDEVMQRVYDDIDMFFDDDKINLNKILDNNIIAIASLGLWNGRKKGYKILGNNLNEILNNFSCDEYEITYDNHNIHFKGHHHDGSNYIEFREVKNSDNIDVFLNKIYSGDNITRSMINYYTKPLGRYMKEIYGV